MRKETVYTASSRKTIYICCTLFLIIGLIVVRVGVSGIKNCENWKKQHSIVVTATVINDHIIKNFGDDGTVEYHHPVFKYTYNDNEYEIENEVGKIVQKYKVGDTAELHINPSNPTDFYDPSDGLSMFPEIVTCSVGVSFMIISVLGILHVVTHPTTRKKEY